MTLAVALIIALAVEAARQERHRARRRAQAAHYTAGCPYCPRTFTSRAPYVDVLDHLCTNHPTPPSRSPHGNR